MKWIIKKLLVDVVIPALIAIGLLSLAGVDIEKYVDELLGLITDTTETTTESTTQA